MIYTHDARTSRSQLGLGCTEHCTDSNRYMSHAIMDINRCGGRGGFMLSKFRHITRALKCFRSLPKQMIRLTGDTYPSLFLVEGVSCSLESSMCLWLNTVNAFSRSSCSWDVLEFVWWIRATKYPRFTSQYYVKEDQQVHSHCLKEESSFRAQKIDI